MFKRLVGLLTISLFGFAMSFTGCSKEKTIMGPTEYDTLVTHDTVVVHDTVTVIDSVNKVCSMHAYAVATASLDPEIIAYLEQTYTITVTDFIGNYSGFNSSATEIKQNGNVFTIAGVCIPLFYFRGSSDQYFDVVEFSDLVLTYNGGDPSDFDNWSGDWASSSVTFKSHAMKVLVK